MLDALAAAGGGVLAMLTEIEGRFYRPVGAMMAFLPDGGRVGHLSGGCIEGDLAGHAARLGDTALRLRYGAGSPFMDITLPCGAGIEVTLRRVAAADLGPARAALAARQPAVLALPDLSTLHLIPPLRIILHGDGAEADAFGALARVGGYDLIRAGAGGLPPPAPDAFTALLLMFHDHDAETAILRQALDGPAFWIGAMGSHTAHAARCAALRAQGVTDAALSRIHAPVGLLRGARDPRSIAISALAQIAGARSQAVEGGPDARSHQGADMPG